MWWWFADRTVVDDHHRAGEGTETVRAHIPSLPHPGEERRDPGAVEEIESLNRSRDAAFSICPGQGSAPFSPAATGLILVTESSCVRCSPPRFRSLVPRCCSLGPASATSAVGEVLCTLMYSEMKIWWPGRDSPSPSRHVAQVRIGNYLGGLGSGGPAAGMREEGLTWMPAAVVVIGLGRWAWQRNASSGTHSEPLTQSHPLTLPTGWQLGGEERMPGGRTGSP